MLLIEELSQKLSEYRPKLKELHSVLNIEAAKEEIEQLHNKAAEPGFWDDIDKSQKVLQKTKSLETAVENDRKLCAGGRHRNHDRDVRRGKRPAAA